MITTKEMFTKFKQFVDHGDFGIENNSYRIEYATLPIGLEMGFYSLSKTDLIVGGIKRGRIIKKIKNPFCGFKYYFLNNQLAVAKRVIDDMDNSITFLQYHGDYCFGFTFDVSNTLIPMSCFVYEIDKGIIKAFKSSRSCPSSEVNPIVIRDEKYNYIQGNLISIEERISFYDYTKENERISSKKTYDYFTGKYWVQSKNING